MSAVTQATAKGEVNSKSPRVFPEQLHYVLTEMELHGQSHIASWQPHGRSFKVHSRDKFVADILPTYVNDALRFYQYNLTLIALARVCYTPNFCNMPAHACLYLAL